MEPVTPPEPDFIIKGNPVIKKNGRPVHTNRATGKPMIGKSGKLRAAEEDAIWQLKQQMGTIIEPLPVPYPLHITFMFYRGNRSHVDLSNLYEFPQDCLQTAGIIENDCLIESHDGSRKRYDKDNPRTEIFIERYAEEDGSAVPIATEEAGHSIPVCKEAPSPSESTV